MSNPSQNIVQNNDNHGIMNINSPAKIFIWDNKYFTGSYTNDTYDPITLTAGTLLGRVSATQKLIPLASGASDGSQFPVGVLAETITIADGDTSNLSVCNFGSVVEQLVILDGSDTMNTVISGKSIRDRIASDTMGIKLVSQDQLTGYDNQ
jgi:hypothetical protein